MVRCDLAASEGNERNLVGSQSAKPMNYSDRECEDVCGENGSVHAFPGTAEVPDRTTLREFRNTLASLGVMRALFERLAGLPGARGPSRRGDARRNDLRRVAQPGEEQGARPRQVRARREERQRVALRA